MTETVSPEEYQRRRGLWTSDLRSGDFKQGRSALRNGPEDSSEFCCLGVACETYRRETGKGHWERRGALASDSVTAPWHFVDDGAPNPEHFPAWNESWSSLPGGVAAWFGLNPSTQYNPQVATEWGNEHVANLNDRRTTFEEIADLIDIGFVEDDG